MMSEDSDDNTSTYTILDILYDVSKTKSKIGQVKLDLSGSIRGSNLVGEQRRSKTTLQAAASLNRENSTNIERVTFANASSRDNCKHMPTDEQSSIRNACQNPTFHRSSSSDSKLNSAVKTSEKMSLQPNPKPLRKIDSITSLRGWMSGASGSTDYKSSKQTVCRVNPVDISKIACSSSSLQKKPKSNLYDCDHSSIWQGKSMQRKDNVAKYTITDSDKLAPITECNSNLNEKLQGNPLDLLNLSSYSSLCDTEIYKKYISSTTHADETDTTSDAEKDQNSGQIIPSKRSFHVKDKVLTSKRADIHSAKKFLSTPTGAKGRDRISDNACTKYRFPSRMPPSVAIPLISNNAIPLGDSNSGRISTMDIDEKSIHKNTCNKKPNEDSSLSINYSKVSNIGATEGSLSRQISVSVAPLPKPLTTTSSNPCPSTNHLSKNVVSTASACVSTIPSPQPCVSTIPSPQPCVSTIPSPQSGVSIISSPQSCVSTIPSLQTCVSTIPSQTCVSTIPSLQTCVSITPSPQSCVSAIPLLQTCVSITPSPQSLISTTISSAQPLVSAGPVPSLSSSRPPVLSSVKSTLPPVPANKPTPIPQTVSQITTDSSSSINSLPVDFTKLNTITVNGRHYIKQRKIGQGGYSTVISVLDLEEYQNKALKIVKLDDSDEASVKSLLDEIKMLQRLQHSSRVVKLYEYEITSDELKIVMEIGSLDLAQIVKNSTKDSTHLNAFTIKHYWNEMLLSVQDIHMEGIIHSDLKPANFLLVGSTLKLIDFGISSSIQKDMTSVVKDNYGGTINYMSPESLSNINGVNKIGVKSDIWSLGCILYVLTYGKTPFQHVTNIYQKINVITNRNTRVSFPPTLKDDNLLDVLKKCLQFNPKDRPSIKELLDHPYLKSG